MTTFTYDAAGRRTSIARPSGVRTATVYDGEGRIATLTEERSGGGTLASTALVRDLRGFVVSARRDVPLPLSAPLRAVRVAVYDSASRVAGASYDANGRVVADGARVHDWDLAFRMTGYRSVLRSVSFEYDALGALASRSEGGVVRDFVWNYALVLPSVSVARLNGADRTYYVHTPDGELLHAIDAATGRRHHFHYDERGNALFLTDDEGTIVASYAYTPYGLVTESNPEIDNSFTFGGRFGVIREPGTDLYLMRARWYDAAARRFLSRDTRLDQIHPLAVNPYAYAAANPMQFDDPTGGTPRYNGGTADDILGGTSATGSIGALFLAGNGVGLVGKAAASGAAALDATVSSTSRTARALIDTPQGRKGLSKILEQNAKLQSRAESLRGTAGFASGLGNTLKVVGGVLTTVKVAEKITDAKRQSLAYDQQVLSTLNAQVAGVRESLRQKMIAPERARELEDQFVRNANELLAAESATAKGLAGFFGLQNRQLGIAIETVRGIKGAIGSLVPVPLEWLGLGDGGAVERRALR